MKRIIIAMAFVFFATTSFSGAQEECEASQYKTKCIKQLNDGFTYVKSYVLDNGKSNKDGEIEYSFVFSKGTSYMLAVTNDKGESEGIEVTLLDPKGKKLATNIVDDEYYPISYSCKATGVYYMKFKLNKDNTKCGVSVLGFKR